MLHCERIEVISSQNYKRSSEMVCGMEKLDFKAKVFYIAIFISSQCTPVNGIPRRTWPQNSK